MDAAERASSSSESSHSHSGMVGDEIEPERSQQSEISSTAHAEPPPKKKRTRTLTTPHQSAVLHALLAKSRFPTTAMREEVGRQIGLSARKVQFSFFAILTPFSTWRRYGSKIKGKNLGDHKVAAQLAGNLRIFHNLPSRLRARLRGHCQTRVSQLPRRPPLLPPREAAPTYHTPNPPRRRHCLYLRMFHLPVVPVYRASFP
ncbi:hypothetical protein BKA82DRAFT_2837843 [Pisolithus tinctorius]|nr:hypothetical protein BKA82DRAFT_2837843 [Pisolithus tinctorius]